MEALAKLTYAVTFKSHDDSAWCCGYTIVGFSIDTNTVFAMIRIVVFIADLQCCSNNNSVCGTAYILSSVSLLQGKKKRSCNGSLFYMNALNFFNIGYLPNKFPQFKYNQCICTARVCCKINYW